MTSNLMELMLLKELMGRTDKSQLQMFDEFEIWMKNRKEKDKQTPKPPTFSLGQIFFIVVGTIPFLGTAANIAQIHLLQMLLDATRTLH